MVTKLPFFNLISEYYPLSVLSTKLYFLEIGPVHQKLWPFKCMMLKTFNSNFLDQKDTLSLDSYGIKYLVDEMIKDDAVFYEPKSRNNFYAIFLLEEILCNKRLSYKIKHETILRIFYVP